jgi:predicted dehydrogenase
MSRWSTIAPPTSFTSKVSRAILEAGKHVVSEKPLARTTRESSELVERAARAGVVNAIHFNYRNYPLVQQMRAMVASGELGRLFLLHGSYLQDWLILPSDYNWRVESAEGGESRAIADIGSHWFDTVQFVTGDPVAEVLGDLHIVHKTRKKPSRTLETFSETFADKTLGPSDYTDTPVTTEDCATILFRTRSGAPGSVVISQVSAGRKNHFQIELDYAEGALRWNQEEPNTLWIGRRALPNQSLIKDASLMHAPARPFTHYPGGHPEGYAEGPYNLFMQVYAHIESGAKTPPTFSTFKDGHDEIAICEAILTSNRARAWTKVAY